MLALVHVLSFFCSGVSTIRMSPKTQDERLGFKLLVDSDRTPEIVEYDGTPLDDNKLPQNKFVVSRGKPMDIEMRAVRHISVTQIDENDVIFADLNTVNTPEVNKLSELDTYVKRIGSVANAVTTFIQIGIRDYLYLEKSFQLFDEIISRICKWNSLLGRANRHVTKEQFEKVPQTKTLLDSLKLTIEALRTMQNACSSILMTPCDRGGFHKDKLQELIDAIDTMQ